MPSMSILRKSIRGSSSGKGAHEMQDLSQFRLAMRTSGVHPDIGLVGIVPVNDKLSIDGFDDGKVVYDENHFVSIRDAGIWPR